jgi:hypothetical protein
VYVPMVAAGVVALVDRKVAAHSLVAHGGEKASSLGTVQYRQRGNLEPVPPTSSKDSSRSSMVRQELYQISTAPIPSACRYRPTTLMIGGMTPNDVKVVL